MPCNKHSLFYSLLLLGGLLLFSCNDKPSQANELPIGEVITIDLDSKDELFHSELVDQVRFVPLETTDDVLIKDITRLECLDDVIYLLDRFTKTFYAFDMNGLLLWKVKRIGDGPQEYRQLVDFALDKSRNRIYLFSRYNKVQIYDFAGTFIREFYAPWFGLSIAVNPEGYIYLYTANSMNSIEGKDIESELLIYNEYNEEMKEAIPFVTNAGMRTYNYTNPFVAYGDETRFAYHLSNNIYSIKGDSIYIKYALDFGKYNIPAKFFQDKTIDDLEASTYTYGLNSYWENSQYLGFNITANSSSKDVIYHKDSKRSTISFYDDFAYCFPNITSASEEFLLGYRQADDLHLEYQFQQKERVGTILEEVVTRVPEDDNPVVFFYYFK